MITRNILLLSLMLACNEKTTQISEPTDGSDTESEENETTEEENEASDSPEYAEGVSTLAGSGDFSSIDGADEQASFAEPKAIRMRADGVLVVADSGTGAIRLVDFDGTVTTLDIAGTTPVAPSGIAIAEDGTLYVSDYEQHCIYQIQGVVSSVFAGVCGEKGYQNSEAGAALFENPRGLALDEAGNLLVADAGNNAIRSIAPDGSVSTFAGTGEKFVISSEGPALEANVYLPFGLAIHPDGDVFISGFDHCIRRVQDGYIEDIAGLCLNYGNTGNTDGAAEEARFDTPLDIAFLPDGRLAIADSFNDRVRVLSADLSEVSTLAGTETGYLDGGLEEAMFDVPRSLTTDTDGNIYVADSVNNRIRVIAW